MNYSTVGNIPDIFKGISIGNAYERKIKERTGRYDSNRSFPSSHAGPCVSQMRGDVGQASNARQSFPVNGPPP